MRTAAVACAVLTLMAIQGAAAQQSLRVTNITDGPRRAGLNGTHSTVLDPPGDNWVLFDINWREASDQPCILAANFWTVENGNRRVNGQLLNGCRTGVIPGIQGQRAVTADRNRRAISGVRVCTNNRSGINHEMKGLVGHFSQVSTGTATRVQGGRQEVTYVNCRTWHPANGPVRCPEGKVVTALIVHHDNTAERPGTGILEESIHIKGLSLRCGTARMIRGQ
jgi:hypothetical protein